MMASKPDISLITSLYRSENQLADYLLYLQKVAKRLDLQLQTIIVANDATAQEQHLLEQYADTGVLSLTVLDVPRESLYASWNRGIEAADADILGFWNVDDIRTAEGLREGFRLLSTDAELVDFSFQLHKSGKIKYQRLGYIPKSVAPKTGVSSFFMFRRSLYQAAGRFNEHFRIAGDFEWSKRPVVRQAKYRRSRILGGHFILGTDNLSGGNSDLEWVEFNIALIWRQHYHLLHPVEPELMRTTWETWGHTGGTLPDQIAEWLWGKGAQERYQQYQRERAAHPIIRRIRLALARYHLIKSVEWDAHHKKKQ